MYRGQLMKNPSMMFFLERIDTPLMDIDVTAWLLLAQITEDITLPSTNEMKEYNLATLLDAMQVCAYDFMAIFKNIQLSLLNDMSLFVS